MIPRDDAFTASLQTVSVATASLARYYLRKLQIVADGKNEPEYTPNQDTDVTLEHVLPQRPGTEWNMAPEVTQALYNRLGNLALLTGSVNFRLGNVGFDMKKPVLQASSYSLTSMIGTYSNWEGKEIAERQEKLAQYAAKAWPLLV